MSDYPGRVHVMEVGPRDGLQIEPAVLPAEVKAGMIRQLVAAGLTEIECGSFVSPKAVPQMASTSEVLDLAGRAPGVAYRVLWLNLKGLDQAMADPRIDKVGRVSLTASETFMLRNTRRSIEDALADIPEWMAHYDAAGLPTTQLGIMAAFGCNFEGRIPQDKVLDLIRRGAAQISGHGGRMETLLLADTMGWANPAQMERMLGAIRETWPDLRLRLHLHDTRGAAMANTLAALRFGVAEFETSVGGLGGCPFAGHKGAAGNLATEDLVFLLHEMGIETGIDLDALIETARWTEEVLGHPLPGKVMKGGSLSRLSAEARQ